MAAGSSITFEIAALLANKAVADQKGSLFEALAGKASGSRGWSHSALKKHLAELASDSAGHICGHVFRGGELCYNCRQCQADGSCVLCEACFKRSNHEGHDFSFHLAGPGGCCDCGDTEAWNPAGMCDQHSPAAADDEEAAGPSDPAAAMEPALRSSLQSTAAALGRCLQEMAVSVAASYGRTDMTPRPGESEEGAKAKGWAVVLHNDDVHTYQEVSTAIRDLCRATNAEALDMTRNVRTL